MKKNSQNNGTKIVLLGTGTPNTDPLRSGPCVAVIVNGQPYIFDLGPGMVRRAAEAHQAGIAALENSKLTRAFLTHLHSDHTAGYPDFLMTPWVLGREEPIQVHGPEGTKVMTDHLVSAFQQDIDQRIHGLEKKTTASFRVNVEEIDSDWIYQDDNVQVEAFPVRHGDWQAFGFRIISADRIIVISGDTAPNENISDFAKNCDVLIHEVYSIAGFKTRPDQWQFYHSNYHTSSYELAELALKTQPGLLVLYHQLFWGFSEESLLNEIHEKYSGKVHSGKDLDVI
ncbi:MAG: MBL fold metallo-hydrolase [Anaerolineaceae bacterium]|nr:MBL fold metallo-hydrolase [Anaerolineaceae bacterium]